MTTLQNDTICAISTPPGMGGIAVIRISGHDAITIADKLWKGKRLAEAESHTARFGRIVDPANGQTIDEAVATVFRAPASFTGENVVEISVHGSRWIQSQLIKLLIDAGCRLAEPGEFTRRAFASGKLDLAEAEAVADVIASSSRASHRLAMSQMRGDFSKRLSQLRDKLLELASLLELELDFSEEHVEFADRKKLLQLSEETRAEVDRLAASFSTGDAIRRGIPVAIIGQPNVGKSSILNCLLNDNRAIVSDIPGTTRDTIEDTAEINGYTFRFIDTAGLRETADAIESLGIERTWEKASKARIILWVITPSDFQETDNLNGKNAIADAAKEITQIKSPEAILIPILNKCDLITEGNANHIATQITDYLNQASQLSESNVNSIIDKAIAISAHTQSGLNELREALVSAIEADSASSDDIIITNSRHYEALTSASESLSRVISGLSTTLSADFIAQDVRETIHHLSSITGAITTPDILSTIFSRFCIGK